MTSTKKSASRARLMGSRTGRRIFLLLVLCAFLVTLAWSRPAAAARLCCLDEWQGGGVCPPGQKLASQCGIGCENCGTFYCVSGGTFCYM